MVNLLRWEFPLFVQSVFQSGTYFLNMWFALPPAAFPNLPSKLLPGVWVSCVFPAGHYGSVYNISNCKHIYCIRQMLQQPHVYWLIPLGFSWRPWWFCGLRPSSQWNLGFKFRKRLLSFAAFWCYTGIKRHSKPLYGIMPLYTVATVLKWCADVRKHFWVWFILIHVPCIFFIIL